MPKPAFQENEGISLTQGRDVLAGLALLGVFSMTVPFQVIFRHGHGSRYFGVGSVLTSLVLTVLWTGMWPEADPRPMFAFYYLFLAAVVVRGVQCARRRRRPQPGVHSSYTGTPYLLTRWMGDLTAKRKAEPALLFLAGLALFQASEPLGSFFMVGAGCLVVEVAMAMDAQRCRNEAIADARIEAEMLRDRRFG